MSKIIIQNRILFNYVFLQGNFQTMFICVLKEDLKHDLLAWVKITKSMI